MARKPILISGAGVSSLLLAQSLAAAAIPFRIYERDASFDFRGQGYRLRLSDHGLDAIERALPKQKWEKFWATCSQTSGVGFRAWDAIKGEVKETEVQENLKSRNDKTIGIARGEMRKLFAEGLEDQITWDKKVTGYELTETGVQAVFADGTKSEEGDMLVGGEGIYSKIAKQLSGGKLKVFDTGSRGIHGQAPTTVFKVLGEGVHRIEEQRPDGSKVFIITNVRPGDMDDPDIKFGWTMAATPGAIKAPNDDYSVVGKPAADMARKQTAMWDERLKPIVHELEEKEAAFWKITCSSPSGIPEWTNEPRVTVIGDAVHSMTPAGGIGANTAVRDSELLGRLIKEAGGFEKGITEAYEREMRVYGSEAVHSSYTFAKNAFGVEIDEDKTPTVN